MALLTHVNKAWGTSFASVDRVDFPGRKDELTAFEAKVPSGDPQARRRWLDFIDWYRDAMTDGRTGGWKPRASTSQDADLPLHRRRCGAASRVELRRAVPGRGEARRGRAHHQRRVELRGQLRRSRAGSHRRASITAHTYGFEPAGAEDEVGIVARIYNATASGANQLHDYNPNVVSSQSRMDAQRSHIKWLFHVPNPIVPVALWYPNVSI